MDQVQTVKYRLIRYGYVTFYNENILIFCIQLCFVDIGHKGMDLMYLLKGKGLIRKIATNTLSKTIFLEKIATTNLTTFHLNYVLKVLECFFQVSRKIDFKDSYSKSYLSNI